MAGLSRTIIAYLFVSLIFPYHVLGGSGNLSNTTRIIEGKKYLLLDEVSAKEYLTLKLKCPNLVLKLKKSEKLIHVKEKEIKILEKMNTNMMLQKEALEDEVVTLREQQLSANAWYKSPYLWTTIGLICGIGLTIGVLYGVQGDI